MSLVLVQMAAHPVATYLLSEKPLGLNRFSAWHYLCEVL
jgi:hypothetical protein